MAVATTESSRKAWSRVWATMRAAWGSLLARRGRPRQARKRSSAAGSVRRLRVAPAVRRAVTYLERFGLTHRPLPRDACGPTFDDHADDYARLARIFAWLSDEPGLGVLVGDSGTGTVLVVAVVVVAAAVRGAVEGAVVLVGDEPDGVDIEVVAGGLVRGQRPPTAARVGVEVEPARDIAVGAEPDPRGHCRPKHMAPRAANGRGRTQYREDGACRGEIVIIGSRAGCRAPRGSAEC
jgi:hypothetical protein